MAEVAKDTGKNENFFVTIYLPENTKLTIMLKDIVTKKCENLEKVGI